MAGEYLVGIEIGGTKLQMLRANLSMQVTRRIAMRVGEERTSESIMRQIAEGLKFINSGEKPLAIGVGFGGPVDYNTGRIIKSHQVEGWDDFDLGRWLQDLTGAPVYIDNDANVAALGEALMGEGKMYDKVFYMTIGSGIGGGMILSKNIYHGAYPGEVEVGHLRLNKSGDTLESCSSGWAIDQRIRDTVRKSPEGVLARLVGDARKGEAAFLKDALRENDHAAKEILYEAADNIGFALSHVVHLFHPEIIILGGGISLLGEDLVTPVANALPRYVMSSFLPAPPVKIAALKEDAVPMGALHMALLAMGNEG